MKAYRCERVDGFETGTQFPEAGQVSGLIVFGGEMNVDETARYPWLLAERHLMRPGDRCRSARARYLPRRPDAGARLRWPGSIVAPTRELGFHPDRHHQRRRARSLAAERSRAVTASSSGTRTPSSYPREQRCSPPATRSRSRRSVRTTVPGASSSISRSTAMASRHGCGPRENTLVRDWKREPAEVRAELDLYLGAQQERSRRLITAFARRL